MHSTHWRARNLMGPIPIEIYCNYREPFDVLLKRIKIVHDENAVVLLVPFFIVIIIVVVVAVAVAMAHEMQSISSREKITVIIHSIYIISMPVRGEITCFDFEGHTARRLSWTEFLYIQIILYISH